MTVRRDSVEYFDETIPEVASAVRSVLENDPPYQKAVETEKDAKFSVRVQRSWYLAPTQMNLELIAIGHGTQLRAKTESQGFIMGDLFDLYRKMIAELLQDVQKELRRRRLIEGPAND